MSILEISIKTTYIWIRIFGYGFSIDWNKTRFITFSERNGINCYKIGRVVFRKLTPTD